MTGKAFLDTNVAVYVVGRDEVRRHLAQALVATGPVVSVQVITEFVNVCLRKLRLNIGETRELAEALISACEVHGA